MTVYERRFGRLMWRTSRGTFSYCLKYHLLTALRAWPASCGAALYQVSSRPEYGYASSGVDAASEEVWKKTGKLLKPRAANERALKIAMLTKKLISIDLQQGRRHETVRLPIINN
jgi:hypothetical protein